MTPRRVAGNYPYFMIAIATIVAFLALVVSIASAAFTRGQLIESQRANHLSEHARSTALDVEQRDMVLYREEVTSKPGPGQYSGIHPNLFTSGSMEFQPEGMYLEARLTLLNMGPGNCFRINAEVSRSEGEDFKIMTSRPILRPGESLGLEIEWATPRLPSSLELSVTWRDELGAEQKHVTSVDDDGYFAGARTNAVTARSPA